MFGKPANTSRATSVLDYLIGLAQLRTRSSPDLAGLTAVVWLSELASAPGATGRFLGTGARPSFLGQATHDTPWAVVPAPSRPSASGVHEVAAWERPGKGPSLVGDPHAALYRVLQAERRRADELELQVGLGLLVWRRSDGEMVRRHLLTVPAALYMDAVDGQITLQGLPGSPPIELEFDAFPPEVRPADVKGARRPLQLAGGDPFHRGVMKALNAISRALPGRPAVVSGGRPGDGGANGPRFDAADDRPRIELAPALLLRRRSARGAIEALRAIRAQVEGGAALPRLFADMCEVQAATLPKGYAAPLHESPLQESALFPLPANPEQVRILERLRGADGVVVQGPPGTGKTQTIANLICHLLAEGQRVLVTAQTSRALAPVRQLLPAELRPLCVSWLGSGRAEQSILFDGVRGYLDRMVSNDPDQSSRSIAAERARVESLARREEHLSRQLASFHAARAGRYAVAGGEYAGVPAQMARRLQAEAARIGFVPDLVSAHAAPPDADDVIATIEMSAALPVPIAEASTVPDFEDVLVDPDGFDGWLRILADARSADAARAAAPFVKTLEGAHPDDLSEFGAAFRDLRDGVTTVRRRGSPWVQAAINEVFAGAPARWEELARETDQALRELPQRARAADLQDVRMPAEGDLDGILESAIDLREHLRNGGRIRRGPFRAPVVQRTTAIWRDARVDGRRCDEQGALLALEQHLRTRRDVLRLRRLWSALAALPDAPLASVVAAVQEQRGLLQEVLDLAFFHARARAALRQIARLPEPIWSDPVALADYEESARAVLAGPARGRAEEELARIGEAVRAWAPMGARHPAIDRLIVAIAARDAAGYRRSYSELDRARGAARGHAAREDRDRQTARRAPLLHAAIHRSRDPERWRDNVTRLADAWEHARARTWLARFLSDHDDQPVIDELQRVREQRRHATERLAAALAWRHAQARVDPERRRRLEGWRQASLLAARAGAADPSENDPTENDPAGDALPSDALPSDDLPVEDASESAAENGRAFNPADSSEETVLRHRRDAWNHLIACRDAIPAWVMPLQTVFRSCEMRPLSFDVAIVDEASQCGPDALALLFLARRVLVVGDDQQIRPTPIGIERQAVDALVETHLRGLTHKDVFRPEASLFDHAIRRFPERIVLREHFRCAPEIIRFSDRLCYADTPLLPLRPRAADLAPVCAQFVPGAAREGTGAGAINHREALAIARKVVVCAEDPRYAGRSFGVITLQGVAQARRVEAALIEALGPARCEQLRLLCGNAMSFQGDERDVIFLSLVAAPNDVGAPLTRSDFTQRFNVAASRARDQMWLFHSVTPDQLSAKDLRRRLLEFFLDASTEDNGSVPSGAPARERSAEARSSGLRSAAVASGLATAVSAWLAARSIEAYPADRSGGDPRDLVVVAPAGRAVLLFEDDGSSGSERAARQELLQRSGYRTICVREAGFCLDPERELGSVLPPRVDPRAVERRAAPLALEPYGSYQGGLPDPTRAPIDAVVEALVRMVAIEGPVTARRLHRVFAEAAGVHSEHLTLARSLALDESLREASSTGRVATASDDGDTLYALPGVSLLRPRARGPRRFSEIPPSELLAIAARLPMARADSAARMAKRLLDALSVNDPSADDLTRARVAATHAVEWDDGTGDDLASDPSVRVLDPDDGSRPEGVAGPHDGAHVAARASTSPRPADASQRGAGSTGPRRQVGEDATTATSG